MCRVQTTLALLCLVAGSRQLSLIEFSVPPAAEAGEDVELRCKYNLEPEENAAALFVKWWVTPYNSTGDRLQLYQRIIGQNASVVKHHDDTHHNVVLKENDTIVLQSVSPASSGLYECEVSNIDEFRQYQQLTVFSQGSGPQVNVSNVPDGPDEDDADDVLVECRADGVSPAPEIALTVDGKEYKMKESTEGPDASNLYDIVGNYTFSKGDIIGSEIRCELFFVDTTINNKQYVDTLVYDSGATTTVEPAEEDYHDQHNVTSDSPVDNQSGDGTQSRISFVLLLTVGGLIQLSNLL